MVSKSIIVLWTLFCIVNFVVAINTRSTQLGGAQPSDLFAMAAMGTSFFLWVIVVVPTAIVGLLFKKAKA